jgi:hypothetical protein
VISGKKRRYKVIYIEISVNMPYGAVVSRWEALIIDKLSSLPKGGGSANVGRWTSHSRYLGRTLSGNYLLRNWHLETYGPDRGGSLADPVGWFIDSNDWDDPFLLLSNFDQTDGIGKLRREPDDPNLPSVAKAMVNWFKGK